MNDSKVTPYGQKVLDVICDRVVEGIGMGWIGWAIGETDEIVRYVADKLNKPIKSVAGCLSHLIDTGYFSNSCSDDVARKDGLCYDVPGLLAIRHKAWLAYSKWDVSQIICHFGGDNEPELLTQLQVEEPEVFDFEWWLEWDGQDGTDYPYYLPESVPEKYRNSFFVDSKPIHKVLSTRS